MSPVESFRRLLAMAPPERDVFLSRYTPAKRGQILEKVREYEALPPEECALRLHVTELRWYLLPLLKLPPDKRAGLLEPIPEPYKQLVSSRLEEWDMWPPDLKDEVLDYESLIHYFIGRNTEVRRQKVFEDVPEKSGVELGAKLADWRALPLDQRQRLYGSFQRYFELSEEERKQVLASLPEPERRQTENVVNSIEKRPKSDREAYLAAFRQFAEMPPAELQNFMNNSQRWQKMSLAEREAWRDVLQRLATVPGSPSGLVPKPTGPVVPVSIKTNTVGAPLR